MLGWLLPGSWSDTLCCADRDKEAAKRLGAVEPGAQPIFPQPKPSSADGPDGEPALALANESHGAEPAGSAHGSAQGSAPPASILEDVFLTGESPTKGGASPDRGGTVGASFPADLALLRDEQKAVAVAEQPPSQAVQRSASKESAAPKLTPRTNATSRGSVIAQSATTASVYVNKSVPALKSVHERQAVEDGNKSDSSVSSDSSLENGINDCEGKLSKQLKVQKDTLQKERQANRKHGARKGDDNGGDEILGDIENLLADMEGDGGKPRRMASQFDTEGSGTGSRPPGAYGRTGSVNSMGSVDEAQEDDASSTSSKSQAEQGEGVQAAAEEPAPVEEDGDDEKDPVVQWRRKKWELLQKTRLFGHDPSLTNDEDVPVYLDRCGTGLYHCGRMVSPYTKEFCGPPKGEQCQSCQRLEHAMKDQRMGEMDIKTFQATMRAKMKLLSEDEDAEFVETLDPTEVVKNSIMNLHMKSIETQTRLGAKGNVEQLPDDKVDELEEKLQRLRADGAEWDEASSSSENRDSDG